jgi:hypothetical protein
MRARNSASSRCRRIHHRLFADAEQAQSRPDRTAARQLRRGRRCAQRIEQLLSLPSGYHRDLQYSKAPLLRAFAHGLDALALVPDLLRG